MFSAYRFCFLLKILPKRIGLRYSKTKYLRWQQVSNFINSNFLLGVLSLGVSDIQYDDVQKTTELLKLKLWAYISVGSKFIDVVVLTDKDSKVQIPLNNARENIQIILK